jgi:hypothetical protein
MESMAEFKQQVQELAARKSISILIEIPPSDCELGRRREEQRKEFERNKWRWEPHP